MQKAGLFFLNNKKYLIFIRIFGQMPLDLTQEQVMSVSEIADLTKYSFYRYTCFGKFIQCNFS